eukprot:758750-Hanusia_phi.AAC.2
MVPTPACPHPWSCLHLIFRYCAINIDYKFAPMCYSDTYICTRAVLLLDLYPTDYLNECFTEALKQGARQFLLWKDSSVPAWKLLSCVLALHAMDSLQGNYACLSVESGNLMQNHKRNLNGPDNGADDLIAAVKKAKLELEQHWGRDKIVKKIEDSAANSCEKLDAGLRKIEAKEPTYIGVRWSGKKGKWRVRIKANGKDNHVGFFQDAKSAAQAYDRAVKRFFPNWESDRSIKLNFPPDDQEKGTQPKSDDKALTGIGALLASETRIALSPIKSLSPHCFSRNSSQQIEILSASGMMTTASTSCGQPQKEQKSGTLLAPLQIHSDKEKISDKSSLAHLLDDKTALARTPSPAGTTTPSNAGGGNVSNISTPATLPSPSTLWSPVHGGHSTTRSNVDTPPGISGPPRLCANASIAGAVAPAVWTPGPQALTKQDRYTLQPGGSQIEQEALRGLVELGKDKSVDFALAHHKKTVQTISTSNIRTKDPVATKPEHTGASHNSNEMFGHNYYRNSTTAGGTMTAASTLNRNRPYGDQDPSGRRSQNYRGVTWDKVKQMWRVRLCLAGGGREHIGYFSDEREGAMAYAEALQRLKNELPLSTKQESRGILDGYSTFSLSTSPSITSPHPVRHTGAFSHVGGDSSNAGSGRVNAVSNWQRMGITEVELTCGVYPSALSSPASSDSVGKSQVSRIFPDTHLTSQNVLFLCTLHRPENATILHIHNFGQSKVERDICATDSAKSLQSGLKPYPVHC